MSCVICAKSGDVPLELKSGRIVGTTCDADACKALLWESAVFPDDPKEERDLLAWRIRRHVAAVWSRPFSEPAPETAAEKFFRKHDALKALVGELNALGG